MSRFTTEPPFDTNRQELMSDRDAILNRIEELERRLALSEQSASNLSMVLDATLAGSWDWNIDTGELKEIISELRLKGLIYSPKPGTFTCVD